MNKKSPTANTAPNSQADPASESVRWHEFEAQDHHQSGLEVIQDCVKRLPNQPGVYRMFDADQNVLYVGKARSLKKRVSSYTKMGGHTNRISRMITQTAAMEFVTTHTETEALLLEANLIKRLRPKFNVLLRDDKSFPYIVITKEHKAPGLFKHRGARRKDRSYFGPFASAMAVKSTLNALQKAFLIRTCSDSVFEGRSRPCLLHQIKRCAAPCTGEVSDGDYLELVRASEDFLSGKSNWIKQQLSLQMQKASDALDFEHAARYRDRLAALSHIQSHQGINPKTITEADVFAIAQSGSVRCVQVFFFRTGQNWGNRAFFPRADNTLEHSDILQAFVTQFYDNKPCPRLILTSEVLPESDLVADALSARLGRKVEVHSPTRGEKKALINHAYDNAREAAERRLAESSTQHQLLEGLAKAFDLEAPPKRIEVYDNSHIMGTNAIGAMIVAGPSGFEKNQYRKFNIKTENLVPGDDYGMMREVITRRFSRLLAEHGDKPAQQEGEGNDQHMTDDPMAPWPDLLLIDGGKGQLSAVMEALSALGIEDMPCVGIAKGPDRDAGREKFFVKGRQPFILGERDPVLFFVQRLRDEAHRFAIGSHRARRKKEMTKSPLDGITGIGPARKKALLHHFGTAKAVSRAGLADLKAVEGISEAMAHQIHDYFSNS